jgi:hypothetical protein
MALKLRISFSFLLQMKEFFFLSHLLFCQQQSVERKWGPSYVNTAIK